MLYIYIHTHIYIYIYISHNEEPQAARFFGYR